jgi:hypothetical protein
VGRPRRRALIRFALHRTTRDGSRAGTETVACRPPPHPPGRRDQEHRDLHGRRGPSRHEAAPGYLASRCG